MHIELLHAKLYAKPYLMRILNNFSKPKIRNFDGRVLLFARIQNLLHVYTYYVSTQNPTQLFYDGQILFFGSCMHEAP
jgi:hypothetical protein